MAEEPKGLPQLKARADVEEPAINKARKCDQCGKDTIVLSNRTGVHAHCPPCNRWYPISSTPRTMEMPPIMGRGLSKQTYVEPDWSRALDSTEGDIVHEQVGPKRK